MGVYFFWKWLVTVILLILTVEATTTPPNCHEIPGNTPFSVWKDCNYADGFGNRQGFIKLDFTSATQQELDDFFAKATAGTELSAGIKIVDSDIETLDFGNVAKWTVPNIRKDEPLIQIAGNPKLKEIKLNVASISPKSLIFIYNNPLLKLDYDLVEVLISGAVNSSYFEPELGVCYFHDRTNDFEYTEPTQEFLDLCKAVKGDLKLKNMILNGNLTVVNPYKLTMTNVDTNGCQLEIVDAEDMKDIIVDNTTLGGLRIHTLKSIEQIVIKNNNHFEYLDLSFLQKTDELTIINNVNFKQLVLFELETPEKIQVECPSRVYNYPEEFNFCTVIKGDFKMEKVDRIPTRTHLKEIHGCINISDSVLTELNFLENVAITNCTRAHWLIQSPYVCFPPSVEQSAPVRRKGHRFSCGKICDDLDEGDCKSLYSDLIIHDDMDLNKLKDLEEIVGRLIIKDTRYLEHLNLPSLRLIDAFDENGKPLGKKGTKAVYAIQIIGNHRLKSVTFPQIVTIVQPNYHIIVIENNQHPINVKDLPLVDLKACMDIKSPRCVYPDVDIEEEYTEAETGIPWYYYVLMFCATGGFAIRAALRPWGIMFEAQMRMERMNEEIRHVERKHREEWRQLASRQQKLKYDEIYFEDCITRLKNHETDTK